MNDVKKTTSNIPRGRRPLSQKEMERGRESILAAARALFSQRGYGSVSMRAVADTVGMSPTSLYRFYPNKRAILVHIWRDIFAHLFHLCRKVSEAADEPKDALTGYAASFVGYWVANPEHYLMVYGEIDFPQKGESFFADNKLVGSELVYLGELIAKCGIKERNIELTLQQFLCAMHGVCHSLVTIPELDWRDWELITRGLVSGLLKP